METTADLNVITKNIPDLPKSDFFLRIK